MLDLSIQIIYDHDWNDIFINFVVPGCLSLIYVILR